MIEATHARLLNAEGELIAEGACRLNEAGGEATFEPEREPGVVEKERGDLRLLLDSGRSLAVSDPPMVFRIGHTTSKAQQNGHRRLYRLRLMNQAQDANAAGAAGEGAPASSQTGLSAAELGETPAAR